MVSISQILLVFLILSKGLTLKNCIKMGLDNRKCSQCYQTQLNDFGSCSPYTLSIETKAYDCLISDSVSRTQCQLCEKNYYKKGSNCFELTEQLKTHNCFHYIGVLSSTEPGATPTILCSHCSNGFPSTDFASCSAWSEYTGPANLANCEIATRAHKSEEPYCYRCNQGFSYDLRTKSCIASTIKGCWQTKDGKCLSCKAWKGWFSDFLGSEIQCIRAEDHEIDLIVIPDQDAETTSAEVFDNSEEFMKNQTTIGIDLPVKRFVEFINGYIIVDNTTSLNKFTTEKTPSSILGRRKTSKFSTSQKPNKQWVRAFPNPFRLGIKRKNYHVSM